MRNAHCRKSSQSPCLLPSRPHSQHLRRRSSQPLCLLPSQPHSQHLRPPLPGHGPSPTHQKPVTRRASPGGARLSGLLEAQVPTPDSASADLLAGLAELARSAACVPWLLLWGGVWRRTQGTCGVRSPGLGPQGLLGLGCHVWPLPWTPSEPRAVGAFWRSRHRGIGDAAPLSFPRLGWG